LTEPAIRTPPVRTGREAQHARDREQVRHVGHRVL
jgi:hypothetical protein